MPVQAVAQGEKYVSNALQGGFIENLGQWPDEVLFMANTKSLRAWITTKGMVIEQFEMQSNLSLDRNTGRHQKIEAHVIGIEFLGSNNNAR